METNVETLAEQVRAAKEHVERLKMRHRGGDATYDELATAAKTLSNRFAEYHKAKFPGKRVKHLPYQAILR